MNDKNTIQTTINAALALVAVAPKLFPHDPGKCLDKYREESRLLASIPGQTLAGLAFAAAHYTIVHIGRHRPTPDQMHDFVVQKVTFYVEEFFRLVAESSKPAAVKPNAPGGQA